MASLVISDKNYLSTSALVNLVEFARPLFAKQFKEIDLHIGALHANINAPYPSTPF